MAVFTPDGTLDLGLNAMLRNVATRIDICSTQPTTYAEATSTYTLGNATVDSSDFTLAAGDTSGRKVTLAQQTGISVGATGTAAHLAFTNGTDTLYHVTTITSQAVTSGNTATVNAVDAMEQRDFAAE